MTEGLPQHHLPSKRRRRGMRHAQGSVVSVELDELKRCLLFEHTRVVSDSEVQTRLRRAADDAASIAWATPYPLLVLPTLLDEKLSEARRKAEMQRSIYVRSQPITSLAA